MAVLDALGARLVSSGVGTLGTDLWLAQMQNSPDASVVLIEQQGGVDHVFGASVAGTYRHTVLVVARAGRNDYPSARTKMQAVQASLGAIRNQTISGVAFMSVLDTTGLYPAGMDGDERPMVACEFTCWVTP